MILLIDLLHFHLLGYLYHIAVGHFKRHFAAPRAANQDEMNLQFQGTEFELAERYVDDGDIPLIDAKQYTHLVAVSPIIWYAI